MSHHSYKYGIAKETGRTRERHSEMLLLLLEDVADWATNAWEDVNFKSIARSICVALQKALLSVPNEEWVTFLVVFIVSRNWVWSCIQSHPEAFKWSYSVYYTGYTAMTTVTYTLSALLSAWTTWHDFWQRFGQGEEGQLRDWGVQFVKSLAEGIFLFCLHICAWGMLRKSSEDIIGLCYRPAVGQDTIEDTQVQREPEEEPSLMTASKMKQTYS